MTENDVTKVYLSGPISGRREREVEMHFRRAGWELTYEADKADRKVQIISPATLSYMNLKWDSYMQIARAILKDPTIGAIMMLKGWEKSLGCIMELMWARDAGLEILYEPGARHI